MDGNADNQLHDAKQVLKAIKAGKATGFKPSLYGRAAVEGLFELVGRVITLWPPVLATVFLGGILLVGVLLCIGFVRTDLETSITELWVEEGGRLDSEIEYTDDHLDEGFSPSQEPIVQLVGDNFTASLYDHLNILKAATKITFEYKNMTFVFRDFCSIARLSLPQVPELNRVAAGLAPCLFITPIDCYWEGSFLQEPDSPVAPVNVSTCAGLAGGQNLTWENLNIDQLRFCLFAGAPEYTPFIDAGVRSLQLDGFLQKPCFSSECPNTLQLADPVQEAIVNGCTGYSSLIVEPPSLIYSGNNFERDPSVHLPAALRSGIVLNGPATTQENLQEHRNITLRRDEVEDLLSIWKERFFNLVVNFNRGGEVDTGSRGLLTKVSNDQIYGWTSEKVDELAEEYSDATAHLIIIGYILMIIYCGIAFLYFDWVNSHASVGLMGLLLVALASAAALGLTAACGISFNITTTQIFPFLVLGLGVDDMFVIGDAFFEIQHRKGHDYDIKTLLISTIRTVGPSVTLTSLTNSAGFFLSAIIPIPAIRNFAIQVGLAVIFNYFALLLGLPSFMLIDHYRIKAKLVDFFCCFPAKICCQKKASVAIQNNDDTKALETTDNNQSTWSSFCDQFRRYKSPLTTLVVDYYSPFLQNYIVKLVIIVVFTIWFGFCVWGCTKVEDGLNIEDVVPAGTVEHDFVSANVEHFAAYSFRVVTKDIDYKNRNVQRALLQLSEDTKTARYAVDAGGFTAYWLVLMTQYFAGVDHTYCNVLTPLERGTTFADMTQALVGIYRSLNYTEDPPMVLAGKIAICNSTLTGLPRLVEYDQHGPFIPEGRFYWYIPIWASLDDSKYTLASPSFDPRPPGGSVQTWAINNNAITSYGPIVYAEHNLFCEGLQDTPDFEDFINEIRDLLGRYGNNVTDSYPYGSPFLFWEQYINLRSYVGTACGLILVACFIATSFFLMDLWSAVILVCMLALISAQVFGVTGFLDIKFSSLPAIMIIASVGVSVEFTAPLTFYFLKATANPGEKKLSIFGIQLPTILATWLVTRNERMHKALENRFTPIFNGSVTTFLGIIMLAFAELPFIRQYFFAVLLSIVLLGALNGLVLLPVILSLFGPPAQASPKKGQAVVVQMDAKNQSYEQLTNSRNSVLY